MYAWETLHTQFEQPRSGASAATFEIPTSARRAFAQSEADDIEWLSDALRHEKRKWFVAAVANEARVPEPLFEPMLDAGIDEVDPSFNRSFIEPCMDTFGPRRVNEYLLHVLSSGNEARQAGAVNAMYWAQVPLEYRGEVRSYDIDHATPESRQRYLALSDIWARKRLLLLEIFVNSSSLDVQRSVIASLTSTRPPIPSRTAAWSRGRSRSDRIIVTITSVIERACS
jgi:hypothetical protein